MPRYERTQHGRRQFTAQEEIDADTVEAIKATKKPMRDWKADMQRTDNGMPRYAEDILDGMADKSSVAQITLEKLQAKKDLRATKP